MPGMLSAPSGGLLVVPPSGGSAAPPAGGTTNKTQAMQLATTDRANRTIRPPVESVRSSSSWRTSSLTDQRTLVDSGGSVRGAGFEPASAFDSTYWFPVACTSETLASTSRLTPAARQDNWSLTRTRLLRPHYLFPDSAFAFSTSCTNSPR